MIACTPPPPTPPAVVRADIDGDGRVDTARLGRGKCRVFLVVRTKNGEVHAPVRAGRQTYPGIVALARVESPIGANVVVRVGIGASTEFVAVYRLHGRRLAPLRFADGTLATFGSGGSVSVGSGVDCAFGPGGAELWETHYGELDNRGRRWSVTRQLWLLRGWRVVRGRLHTSRVYRGSLAELARAFPELVRGAFPGCRATARDHPAFRTGGGVLGTQTSLGGVPVSVPHALFHVTNLWLAKRRGLYIDVYAGSLATDERRGALSVTWTDPRVGLPQRRSGIYKAPERVGPLTLTRVAGDRVYFRYRGGSGWFDLRARRFTLRARR